MGVAMGDGQSLANGVGGSVDDQGAIDGRMRDGQTREPVRQLQSKDRHTMRGAEVRQFRERRVSKAESLPLVLGDLLTLSDCIGQGSWWRQRVRRRHRLRGTL